MQANAMHWGLYFSLTMISVALGLILADRYLAKLEAKRAAAELGS